MAGEKTLSRERARQFGFTFDQTRCTGCKTCEVACKDYHGLEGQLAFRTIYEIAGGSWRQDEDGAWAQDVFAYHLSMSCNHCSNPVCVRFCPVSAVVKDSCGFVVVDAQECVGCQSCMVACPYHAPRFDEAHGTAAKCDGCRERVEAGCSPICVEACPQRALGFGVYARLADSPSVVEVVPPMPSPSITQPNYAIEPSEVARQARVREGEVVNLAEA